MPRILHAHGLLEQFYTDSYMGNKPILGALVSGLAGRLPSLALKKLSDRSTPGLPASKVTSFDLLGLIYFAKRRLIRQSQAVDSMYMDAGRLFAGRVVDSGFGRADTIYGFNCQRRSKTAPCAGARVHHVD